MSCRCYPGLDRDVLFVFNPLKSMRPVVSLPDEPRRAAETATRVPTSAIIEDLLSKARSDHITLAWIVGQLGERSFGIVMLLIALVGLVPGASSFAGLLLVLPAIQMIWARRGPILPRVVSARQIPTSQLARLIKRLVPVLKRMERVVRPRWAMPIEATMRLVGFIILLLGATLLAPIPFSHVIPLFVIMLLAFAFLEEDGVLLCIGLLAALVSVAITVAAVWGTIEASLLL